MPRAASGLHDVMCIYMFLTVLGTKPRGLLLRGKYSIPEPSLCLEFNFASMMGGLPFVSVWELRVEVVRHGGWKWFSFVDCFLKQTQ